MLTKQALNQMICGLIGWRSFRPISGMAFPPNYRGDNETELKRYPDLIDGPMAVIERRQLGEALTDEERKIPIPHVPMCNATAFFNAAVLARAKNLISDKELEEIARDPHAREVDDESHVVPEGAPCQLEEDIARIRRECALAIHLQPGPRSSVHEALLVSITAFEELLNCTCTLHFPEVDERWDGATMDLYARDKLKEIVKQFKSKHGTPRPEK